MGRRSYHLNGLRPWVYFKLPSSPDQYAQTRKSLSKVSISSGKGVGNYAVAIWVPGRLSHSGAWGLRSFSENAGYKNDKVLNLGDGAWLRSGDLRVFQRLSRWVDITILILFPSVASGTGSG